jgi:hypothetical protein
MVLKANVITVLLYPPLIASQSLVEAKLVMKKGLFACSDFEAAD